MAASLVSLWHTNISELPSIKHNDIELLAKRLSSSDNKILLRGYKLFAESYLSNIESKFEFWTLSVQSHDLLELLGLEK